MTVDKEVQEAVRKGPPRWYNLALRGAFPTTVDKAASDLGGTQAAAIAREEDVFQLHPDHEEVYTGVIRGHHIRGGLKPGTPVFTQDSVDVPKEYDWIPSGIDDNMVPPNRKVRDAVVIGLWKAARQVAGWKNSFIRFIRSLLLSGQAPATMLLAQGEIPDQFPLRDDNSGAELGWPVWVKASEEVAGTHDGVIGPLNDEAAVLDACRKLAPLGEYQIQAHVPGRNDVVSPHYIVLAGVLHFLGVSKLLIASGNTHVGNIVRLGDGNQNGYGRLTHPLAIRSFKDGMRGAFGFDVMRFFGMLGALVIEANYRWNGGTAPCLLGYLLGIPNVCFRFAKVDGMDLEGIVEHLRRTGREHTPDKPGAMLLVWGSHPVDQVVGIVTFGDEAESLWLDTVESMGGIAADAH